jgi:hypothetical protein
VSERHARFLRSLRLRQTKVLIVQFAVLAAFLGLWQLAATWRIIDPFITSEPSAIAQKFLELANDGSLGYNVAITVFERFCDMISRSRNVADPERSEHVHFANAGSVAQRFVVELSGPLPGLAIEIRN